MMAAPAGTHTELVAEYVKSKIDGLDLTPGQYTAMMVVNDQNDFVAGITFSNYRSHNIEISCASETGTAWRPHVLRAVFTYVFGQLDCVRCTCITSKANKKTRDFLESLGFVLEGNIRLGYGGTKDALIYGLLRSECRYLAGDSEREDGEE